MALLLSLTVSLKLLSLVAANPLAAPQPLITAAAQLYPRQEATTEGWIGYYQYSTSGSSDTSYTAESCGSGMTFFTTGSAVGCCGTSSSGWESACFSTLKTACVSDTIVSYAGTGSTCGSGYTCNPDTIYTSSTADASGFLWYGCMSRKPRLYYQVLPEAAQVLTDSSSSDSSTSSSSTATPGPASSPTTTQTTSPTPTESDTPAPKKESKAWIAGVVVGAVAIIAIAGLAFFFLQRRKKNKEQSYQPAPQMQTYQQYPQSPYMGYASPPQGAMSPNPAPAGVHESKGYYGQSVVPQDNGMGGHSPNNPAVYPQYAAPGQPASTHPVPVSELPALVDPQTNR